MEANQTTKWSMKQMILPTINRNGTADFVLIEQLANASNAISTAIEQLNECAPHGRDYPNGSLNEAVAEHETRRKTLQSMADELMTMAIVLDDKDLSA
jgi:hypothetical protein